MSGSLIFFLFIVLQVLYARLLIYDTIKVLLHQLLKLTSLTHQIFPLLHLLFFPLDLGHRVDHLR